jgi:site-specific DNA-cytosine methylase
VLRFVDDLFSLVAQFGDRSDDHLRRLRTLITQSLGEHAHNLRKQGIEGTPESCKHAFGCVLDCTDRSLKACWSKLIKAGDIMLPFANGEEPHLTLGEVERIRGVVGHATTWAPGLARLLLPRLDAVLASVHQLDLKGARRLAKSLVGSPRLKGDPSDVWAWEQLRVICNIFIRLSQIDQGNLFQVTVEAALPRHIRLTCPGIEKPSDRIPFVMDASGTGYFIIDLCTGRYLWEEYTPEENVWFNEFDSDSLTQINHREFLTEYRGLAALGVDHPGKLIDMINDNRGAVANTCAPKARSHKDEFIQSLLGLIQMVRRQTLHGEYIRTKENPADLPTRPATYELAMEWLRDWERRSGRKTERVLLTGNLKWLNDVGWQRPCGELEASSFFQHALHYLSWMQAHHGACLQEHCPVDVDQLRATLEEGVQGKPVPAFPEFKENFPEKFGPSPTRKALMESPGYTRMQLTRKLIHSPSDVRIRATTLTQELALPEHASEEDPQVLINSAMQKQFADRFEQLSEANRDHSPGLEVLGGANAATIQVQALWDACNPRKAPVRARVHPNMPFASAYSGQNGAGKAAVHCFFQDVRAAEYNPMLREHIQRQAPGIQVDTDVASLLQETDTGSKYVTMYLSPHCTTQSTANPSGLGADDPQIGASYEDCALIFEKHQPAIGIVECVKGVLECRGNRSSAVQRLRKKAPSYHIVTRVVNAAELVSPITGEQACVSHERCLLYAFNKKEFKVAPALSLLQKTVPRRQSFDHLLDHPTEGRAYQVMPAADRRDLIYSWRQSATGIAYTAQIADPQPGRGHVAFTNDVVSPELGLCPVITAAGGSVWIQRSLNQRATIRKLTNREVARLYLVRGFDSTVDRALLADSSEMGQSLLGNMIPQNTNDCCLAQAALLLSEILRDGSTPYERWLARSSSGSEAHGGGVRGKARRTRTQGNSPIGRPSAVAPRALLRGSGASPNYGPQTAGQGS